MLKVLNLKTRVPEPETGQFYDRNLQNSFTQNRKLQILALWFTRLCLFYTSNSKWSNKNSVSAIFDLIINSQSKKNISGKNGPPTWKTSKLKRTTRFRNPYRISSVSNLFHLYSCIIIVFLWRRCILSSNHVPSKKVWIGLFDVNDSGKFVSGFGQQWINLLYQGIMLRCNDDRHKVKLLFSISLGKSNFTITTIQTRFAAANLGASGSFLPSTGSEGFGP